MPSTRSPSRRCSGGRWIDSTDPLTGEPIRDHTHTAAVSAEPSGTVVYLAGNRRAVSAAQACWAEVHFFSSRHSAAGWAATHATTPGEIASHNNAAALGRAVFGGLLADD